MNQYQVTHLTKRLAKDLFDLEWTLPIEVNGRLNRALGGYSWRRGIGNKVIPVKMELARRLLENYSDETIESVIKHELTHWALSVQGRPFDDGHPVFESELKRVGAHTTGVIKLAGNLHTVICVKCGKVAAKHQSQGSLWKYVKPGSRYSTRCCKAKMQYGETIFVEDTNSLHAPKTEVPAVPAQRPSTPARPAAITTATPPKGNVSLDAVLEKGPRGVTNKQMIPAIRKVLDMNDRFLLEALKAAYPDVFQATIRYIGRSYQAKLEAMVG